MEIQWMIPIGIASQDEICYIIHACFTSLFHCTQSGYDIVNWSDLHDKYKKILSNLKKKSNFKSGYIVNYGQSFILILLHENVIYS